MAVRVTGTKTDGSTGGMPSTGPGAGRVSGRTSAQASKLDRSVRARAKRGTYKMELNRIYSFLGQNRGKVGAEQLAALQATAADLRKNVKKMQKLPRPDAMR